MGSLGVPRPVSRSLTGRSNARSRDPWRLADVAFLAIAGAFVALRLFSVPPWDQSVDAYAYWKPVEGGSPYAGATVGAMGAYLYSPAFKLLFVPFGMLPWPVFNALWTVLNLTLLRAIAGRLALLTLLFPPVPFEIISGNVHLLLAAVAVWWICRPALWAIPFLTKVSPGIGVLWHAFRREWRSFWIALGVTAVIVALSFLLVPGWWSDWLVVLRGAPIPVDTPGWYLPISPWVRLPASLVLLAWGALTDRRWAVPMAMLLAMPVLWLNSFALLVALIPLLSPPRAGGLPRGLARRPSPDNGRVGAGCRR